MTIFSLRLLCLASLMLAWATTSSALAGEPLSVDPPQDAREEANDLTYKPDWPSPPDTAAMLTRLGIGTVAVLVVCVGTLWLGKPWLQRMQVGTAGNSVMRLEGSVTLGSRAMLYLVKVGDTQLVAGVDPTGLKSIVVVPASFRDVLTEQIPEPEIAAVLNRELSPAGGTGSSKESP